MKTEVRRGRKFVEYIDDSLPVGTFVQEIEAHDVSYQDEQGAWLPADENWETDSLDGFSFRAQRMNHKVRFDSIGAWRWYPRRNVETEYIIVNRPKCWLTRTNRWGNLLVNGISREGRDITLTSLRNVTRVVHSRWNGIKTDWILENENAPTRFQQQIDIVGLTEVDGWLYGADGEQVARLTPTIAIDAEGNELPTSTSYENGILEFSADVMGAVYPVTIDPDFAGGSADYFIWGQNADYATARSTSVNTSDAATFRIGQNWSGTYYQVFRSYVLFDTSSIGTGSTVTQVNLSMKPNTTTTIGYDIQIVKQNWSSGTREELYDSCLTGTSDDSTWIGAGTYSGNVFYTSGNLSTAWINKSGTTYYSLRSSLDVSGTAPSGNEILYVKSANDATEGNRPKLVVTYTAGSNDYTLTCNAGSYSLTGTSVTLTHTPASQNLTLACSAGSYSLTGTNADLTVKHMTYIVANCEMAELNGLYEYDDSKYGMTIPDVIDAWVKWDGNGDTFPDNFIAIILSDISATSNPVIGDLYGIRFLNDPDISSPYLIQPDDPSIVWYFADGITPSALTVTAASSSQNLTLTCAAGSYSLTGTNADLTVTRHYTLVCEAGSYALTGTNADLTVKRNYVLNLAYPDIIVSGAVGSADYANGYYALTGENEGKPSYIHTSEESWIWWTDSFWYLGDIAFYSTDNVATPDLVTTWVPLGEPIPPPTVTAANAYKLTGSDATLTVQRNYTLVCEPGSYTLTGTDITFGNTKSYTLVCASGSYSLTGSNVDLIVQHNYTLTLESGSYSLTGSDVTLDPTFHYSLICEAGSYTYTGTDISFGNTTAYTLTCEAGAYTLTGSSVSFVIQRNYSLACETGSYSLTGTDVTLTYTQGAQNFTLACETGSYALTGTNAGLTSARTMACNAGSYTLTGTNADFYRALVMACEAGSYALTGTDASLTSHRIFALGMGSYVLVGTSVGLFILSPTPACRTATIEYENRTFAIPHENRTATIEFENRTLEVKCH